MNDNPNGPTLTGIYRVIWRWHFFAGIIVAPILFFMAATGALYIFRQELDEWWRYDVYYSPVQQSTRATLDAQVSAALANADAGGHLERISLFSNPERTRKSASTAMMTSING